MDKTEQDKRSEIQVKHDAQSDQPKQLGFGGLMKVIGLDKKAHARQNREIQQQREQIGEHEDHDRLEHFFESVCPSQKCRTSQDLCKEKAPKRFF
jgi:hypothetical protein